MENNLLKTGQWYWREGEISLKYYYIMPVALRKEYLEFLLTLTKSQRSTTDNIILQISNTKEQEKKFFEL